MVPLTLSPAYRADNQVSESFFCKYKAHIVKGGLQSVTTVVYETFKLLTFHSQHDQMELQSHMQPVVTAKMWWNMNKQQ